MQIVCSGMKERCSFEGRLVLLVTKKFFRLQPILNVYSTICFEFFFMTRSCTNKQVQINISSLLLSYTSSSCVCASANRSLVHGMLLLENIFVTALILFNHVCYTCFLTSLPVLIKVLCMQGYDIFKSIEREEKPLNLMSVAQCSHGLTYLCFQQSHYRLKYPYSFMSAHRTTRVGQPDGIHRLKPNTISMMGALRLPSIPYNLQYHTACNVTQHVTTHSMLYHTTCYMTQHFISHSMLHHTACCITQHLTSVSMLHHT